MLPQPHQSRALSTGHRALSREYRRAQATNYHHGVGRGRGSCQVLLQVSTPRNGNKVYCPGARREAETITEVMKVAALRSGPGSGDRGLLFLITSLLCYLFYMY